MRRKTAIFMVLLLLTVSTFAVTSTLPVTAEDYPDIYPSPPDSGGGPVRPCDPIGGGPGSGGD